MFTEDFLSMLIRNGMWFWLRAMWFIEREINWFMCRKFSFHSGMINENVLGWYFVFSVVRLQSGFREGVANGKGKL